MYLLKSISTKVGKACGEHKMLKDEDKILVCFSGGKDSFVLLEVLEYLKKRYPIHFELKVLVVDSNFDCSFKDKIEAFLKDRDVDFEILSTKINDVLNEQLKVKKFRACFLCSRLRRGIIYDYAIKNGFNKIALGHNLDDAIETHLMNFFYSSKTSFLKPKYLADNGKIEVIRPLIYVDEDLILKLAKKMNFEPIRNECPLKSSDSTREYFKNLICDLKKQNPKIKENAYHAFKNVKELNEW